MKKMLFFAIIIAIAASCGEKSLDIKPIYNPEMYNPAITDTTITIGIAGVGVTNFVDAIYMAETRNWQTIGYVDFVLRKAEDKWQVMIVQGRGEYYNFVDTYYILEGGTRNKFTIVKNDLNLKLIYANIPLKELIDKLIN